MRGMSGSGSAAHITFEALKLRTKIVMIHIPYRGTAPSVTDVLAGQVDCTFTGAPHAFGDLIRREIPRWAEVAKADNVRPDGGRAPQLDA